MKVFETIFYFGAILFILHEIIMLYSVSELYSKIKIYRKTKKDEKSKLLEEDNNLAIYFIMNMFYFLWCLTGLISSQWMLFLLMILLSFIPKSFIFIRILDSIISISILLFLILNKYHFHIDLWNLLMKNI